MHYRLIRALDGSRAIVINLNGVMKKVRIKSYVYLVAVIGLFVVILYANPAYFRQYWSAFLLAWTFAICLFMVLWARRLKHELNSGPWRKRVADLDPGKIKKDTVEGQRQWLIWLYAEEDYEEAARYVTTVNDEVLIDAPCEGLADRVRVRNPEAARRLYKAAMEYYWREGNLATGSGEGLMAMEGVKRLEEKLKKVKG